MRYTYDLDRAERIVYVRASGDFELEATLRVPLELFALPDFEPDFGVIVDLLQIRPGASPENVLGIARNLVRFRALFEHRVAVVPPTQITLAVEVAAAVAGTAGLRVQVFPSVAEARAWVIARDPGETGT
jgi:hypothetical protein